MNPQIIDGQVHGGITQGIAAALFEEGALRRGGQPAHDDDGHVLVPSAAELPSYETDRTETAADNPLGVKGVGETGTIAAAPAVINAVVDALSHLGVTDMPTSGHAGESLEGDRGGEVVIPAPFDYVLAEHADTRSSCSASGEDAKLLAGGHSLLPAMKLRIARPALLVDIGRLADLVVRPRGG